MRFFDGTNAFLLDVHFFSTFGALGDGKMFLSGHVLKIDSGTSQRGLVVGILDQNPPNPVTTPGQSCFDKTARDFLYSGVIAGYAV